MPIIYSKKPLRKRAKHDSYPTPIELCSAGIAHVELDMETPRILDPGAGSGVWGAVARRRWPRSYIIGIELRNVVRPPDYDLFQVTDFYKWCSETHDQFDLIMGNPPYKFAEDFVALSMECLKPGGVLLFLLRLAFLEGQKRGKEFWPEYKPHKILVCSNRPSFTGNNRTDATAYSLYYWRKCYQGKTYLDWLLWR